MVLTLDPTHSHRHLSVSLSMMATSLAAQYRWMRYVASVQLWQIVTLSLCILELSALFCLIGVFLYVLHLMMVRTDKMVLMARMVLMEKTDRTVRMVRMELMVKMELHTTPGSSMPMMRKVMVSVTVLQANCTLVSPTTRLRQRKAPIRLITSGH